MYLNRTELQWVCLAAAIINSGHKEQDISFLESNWCEQLTEMVSMATRSDAEAQATGSNIRNPNYD